MNTRKNALTTALTNSSGKYGIPYWRKKISHATSLRDGKKYESPYWMASFSHEAHRESLSLGTDNREAAAAKAAEMYRFLKATDWDAWKAKYKPEALKAAKAKEEKAVEVTVGTYLEAARVVLFGSEDSRLPLEGSCDAKTFQQYSQSLRRVAGDIKGIADRAKLGHDKWRKAIDAVPLAALTDEAVRAWKHAFLSRAGSSPVAQKHAKTSVNSIVRQCKALFSARRINDRPSVLERIKEKVEFPGFIPFAAIGYEKEQDATYQRLFQDRAALTQAAQDQLEPELYKIFLLALRFGLRRHEIDLLEWDSFRWDDGKPDKNGKRHGVLRIKETDYFKPKTPKSLADMPLDESFAALFRQYQLKAGPQAQFVIECDGAVPRPDAIHFYFRCYKLFDRLNAWLRDHGVGGAKPLHSLRKEYGSMVNAEFGIYAASKALRHGNIGVTAKHYITDEIKVLSNVGELLTGPSNVIQMHREAV